MMKGKVFSCFLMAGPDADLDRLLGAVLPVSPAPCRKRMTGQVLSALAS